MYLPTYSIENLSTFSSRIASVITYLCKQSPNNSFVVLLPNWFLIALSANIKGTILDAESNEPLIGANVYIEGTSKGSATDGEGSYYIADVRHCSTCEYKLKVMYIGYEEFEETITVYKDEDITKDLKINPASVEVETTKITAKKK